MAKKEQKVKQELEAHLYALEREYDLAHDGLIKGKIFSLSAIASVLATMVIGLVAFLKQGNGFLNGNHIVAIVGILAFALIIYFAFVFGRAAKLRAEISKTKKQLEMVAGDKVR